jgi:hypothetical protein
MAAPIIAAMRVRRLIICNFREPATDRAGSQGMTCQPTIRTGVYEFADASQH